jgi:hypothetical protein
MSAYFAKSTAIIAFRAADCGATQINDIATTGALGAAHIL